MALKLILPPTSPLLDGPLATQTEYYVRIIKLIFLVELGTLTLVLSYRKIDADNTPVGEAFAVHPFPTSGPVMRPADLMMSTEASAYRIAYEQLGAYLRLELAGQAIIEDLP